MNFFIFSVNDKKSVVCGLLRFARNDSTHKLVIARVAFATRGNLDMATTIPNQNSSLRRPKACGNLQTTSSLFIHRKIKEFTNRIINYIIIIINTKTKRKKNSLLIKDTITYYNCKIMIVYNYN